MCRPSVSLLLCVLAVAACSKQESPSAEPSDSAVGAETTPSATASATASVAAAAPAAASVAPSHGGHLVAVGSHHVELKLFRRGALEAWILDAKGKAVERPEAYKLSVKQPGDAERKIAMSWSKPTARFTGEAEADAGLTTDDLLVELEVDGEPARGKLAKPVLLVGPEFGGVLLVAGRYGVEVAVAAAGSAEALVRKASGAAVRGGLALSMEAQAEGGVTHTIELEYDAKLARFMGEAKAGVKLAAGPLALMIDGQVAARLPRLALRAEASHGGRVVMVGDFSVELVAKGEWVMAYVFDASAAALADGDLNVQLQVGMGELIELEWDPPSLSYRAKLAAELDLDVEPIRILIQSEGKLAVGALVTAKAQAKLKTPSADVKAKANAKVSGKARAPSVKVTTSTRKKGKAGAKAKIGFGIH